MSPIKLIIENIKIPLNETIKYVNMYDEIVDLIKKLTLMKIISIKKTINILNIYKIIPFFMLSAFKNDSNFSNLFKNFVKREFVCFFL